MASDDMEVGVEEEEEGGTETQWLNQQVSRRSIVIGGKH